MNDVRGNTCEADAYETTISVVAQGSGLKAHAKQPQRYCLLRSSQSPAQVRR